MKFVKLTFILALTLISFNGCNSSSTKEVNHKDVIEYEDLPSPNALEESALFKKSLTPFPPLEGIYENCIKGDNIMDYIRLTEKIEPNQHFGFKIGENLKLDHSFKLGTDHYISHRLNFKEDQIEYMLCSESHCNPEKCEDKKAIISFETFYPGVSSVKDEQTQGINFTKNYIFYTDDEIELIKKGTLINKETTPRFVYSIFKVAGNELRLGIYKGLIPSQNKGINDKTGDTINRRHNKLSPHIFKKIE
jgi:hypothetical protein